jgi:hypothetical protein
MRAFGFVALTRANAGPLEDANHASDSAAFYRNVDAVWPKVIGHR